MRVLITVAALVVFTGVLAVTWLMARGSQDDEAAEIRAVLAPERPPDEPPAYVHCASCHLHDGSGRPDGSIPRLAGQRRAVLQNKLTRIRTGATRLPVMEPFAKALSPGELDAVAAYLSGLPDTRPEEPSVVIEALKRGRALYGEHCAACHGPDGEGHDGLLAPRLCGQHGPYLARRLQEAALETRGEGDAVMQGIVREVPHDALAPIVRWLAAGGGCLPR